MLTHKEDWIVQLTGTQRKDILQNLCCGCQVPMCVHGMPSYCALVVSFLLNAVLGVGDH